MSPDSKEMTLCPGSRSKYFLNVFSKSKMFSVPPSVDTTGIDGTCFWLKGISTKLIRLLTACLHETGVGGHLFPRAHPQFLVCFLLECFNKLSEDNPPPLLKDAFPSVTVFLDILLKMATLLQNFASGSGVSRMSFREAIVCERGGWGAGNARPERLCLGKLA